MERSIELRFYDKASSSVWLAPTTNNYVFYITLANLTNHPFYCTIDTDLKGFSTTYNVEYQKHFYNLIPAWDSYEFYFNVYNFNELKNKTIKLKIFDLNFNLVKEIKVNNINIPTKTHGKMYLVKASNKIHADSNNKKPVEVIFYLGTLNNSYVSKIFVNPGEYYEIPIQDNIEGRYSVLYFDGAIDIIRYYNIISRPEEEKIPEPANKKEDLSFLKSKDKIVCISSSPDVLSFFIFSSENKTISVQIELEKTFSFSINLKKGWNKHDFYHQAILTLNKNNNTISINGEKFPLIILISGINQSINLKYLKIKKNENSLWYNIDKKQNGRLYFLLAQPEGILYCDWISPDLIGVIPTYLERGKTIFLPNKEEVLVIEFSDNLNWLLVQ